MPKKLAKDVLLYGLAPKMTDEQMVFANAVYSDEFDIVFCNAAAGTGKTTISVAIAKLLKEEGRYKDGLLYVFNPVEENKMGFRPGTQCEKEKEYTVPLDNALIEVQEQPAKARWVPDNALENKKRLDSAWVEATTHIFARGTNQKNKVIIIDEAQNWTVAQLRKMLTRCHDSCKVIVIGHTGQCDLPNPDDSGFEFYLNHFREEPRAAVCTLTHNFRGWMARHADDITHSNNLVAIYNQKQMGRLN